MHQKDPSVPVLYVARRINMKSYAEIIKRARGRAWDLANHYCWDANLFRDLADELEEAEETITDMYYNCGTRFDFLSNKRRRP